MKGHFYDYYDSLHYFDIDNQNPSFLNAALMEHFRIQ
jgi:hypothetical protein